MLLAEGPEDPEPEAAPPATTVVAAPATTVVASTTSHATQKGRENLSTASGSHEDDEHETAETGRGKGRGVFLDGGFCLIGDFV